MIYTKIRFYLNSGTPANSSAWVVYLGHTTKTTFASTTDWVPVASMTMVFNGTVTFPSAGNWMEITLTTPFAYNNVDNLVVAVDENTPSYAAADCYWRTFTSGANTGIYYYNDNTNPNPASPPIANARTSNIDQIQFEITAPPCAGTPDPGNTLASQNPVCPGVNFILSLQNATAGEGVTYQWQSSPTGGEPWSNFGTSTATLTTSQTANTYYRCAVTCTNSGITTNSNAVQVTLNTWLYCYCLPTYSSGGASDNMTLVTLGALSQSTSGNTTPFYYNYVYTQNAIPQLPQGVATPLSITFGSDGNQYNGVWVDFDHSGSFETSEFFSSYTNAGASGTVIVNISPSLSSQLGITRMRIRGGDDYQPLNTQACGASSSSWGQAQDFLIEIIEPPSCPPPTDLFTSDIEFDQALLNWTGGDDVVSFDVLYGPDGFNIETEGTLVTGIMGSPYSLTGLQENAPYDWYVRSICDGEPPRSDWAGPVSFTTLCMPISTLPYTQDFEGTWPPECWLDPITASYGWNRDVYGVPHTGLHWAYCNLAGSELFSPEFTLTDDSKVSFWFRAEGSGYPQDMDVKVGEDIIFQLVDYTNTIYQFVEISLEDYTGQTIRISFLDHTGTGGYDYGVLIDDFRVEKICKLEGFVYDYNNNPVAGATVELVDGISVLSEANGHYMLSPLSPGEQTFKCFKTGYTPEYATIEIPAGTIVPHNFILTEPAMAVAPGSLWALLNEGETQTNILEITNNGNGILGWDANIFYDISTYPGGPIMAAQASNNQYAPNGPMCVDAGREQSSGSRDDMVCRDGSYFSLPPVGYNTGYNSSLVNGYKVYQSFSGVSNGIINSIRFWGVFSATPPDRVTYKIDFCMPGTIPGAVVSTVTLPIDAINTGNYMGSYAIYEFNAEVPMTSLPAGWVSVEMLDESPYFFWLNTFAGDYPAYQENAPDPNLPASVSVCLGGIEGWISLDSYTGNVPGFGGSQNVTALLDPAKTPANRAPGVTYNANIVFTSPSGIQSVTVPVTMILTDGGLKGPENLTPFIVDEGAGKFMLKWQYFTLRDMVFDHFEIYSNGVLVGTTPVSNFPLEFTEDGTYCYKVFAVYQGGVYSEPSNEVCITYPLAPGVPVANWALLLGGLLMASFVFFRFYRRS